MTASFTSASSSAVSSSSVSLKSGRVVPLGGLVPGAPQPVPGPLHVPNRMRLHQRLLGRRASGPASRPASTNRLGLGCATAARARPPDSAPAPPGRTSPAPAGGSWWRSATARRSRHTRWRSRRSPAAQVLHDRDPGRMGQRPHHLRVTDRHPARIGAGLGHASMIPAVRLPAITPTGRAATASANTRLGPGRYCDIQRQRRSRSQSKVSYTCSSLSSC